MTRSITVYGAYIHDAIAAFNYDLRIEDYDLDIKGICLNAKTENLSLLSNFQSITTINCFRITAAQIQAFPPMPSVKHLMIRTCDYPGLDFLSKFPNLI